MQGHIKRGRLNKDPMQEILEKQDKLIKKETVKAKAAKQEDKSPKHMIEDAAKKVEDSYFLFTEILEFAYEC